jgi:hypothetical protein
VLQVRRAYLVVGVVGMPTPGGTLPWMDGLLGFVQVDGAGLPVPLPQAVEPVAPSPLWQPLLDRLDRLADIRGATGDWIAAGW